MTQENKSLDPAAEPEMPLVSRLLYQLIDEKYRTLLDESSDFMCIADTDGKFIYVNKKLADSLGFTKKEMLGMRMTEIIAEESVKKFHESFQELFAKGKIVIDNFILKTKFSGKIVGEISATAFYDNVGKYCGAKTVFKDWTKLLEMEKLEKKYESMLEDGIDTLDYIIIILDPAFKVKWASTSVTKYFGLDRAAIIGEDMRLLLKNKISLLVREDEAFLKKLLGAYETQRGVENFEIEVLSSGSGESHIMEHWSYPVIHGDLTGGRVEIFRDITARKKSEETLEYYHKKIHAIMEHAVEGIAELKTDNTMGFVNKSFQNMLGYTEMEMLNHDIGEFIMPHERMHLASVKLIRRAREIALLKKDGGLVYAMISSIPLVFGAQPPHSLCFISDITEARMAANRLRDANLTLKALNDSLVDISLRDVKTGAYNYRYLTERLAEEVRRAKRYFRPFSLIMIDIDFFKAVNDAYGHSFGDVVLKEFADLLRRTVRDTDIVVRSGGEEFVVFLADTDTLGALTVANKIVGAVCATPLGDVRRKIKISISLGVASYPEIGIADAEALLDAADAAMYQSKDKGRNMITVYNKDRIGEKSEKAPAADDFSKYGRLKSRLKSINSRNEEAILQSMMPMVREADKKTGYGDGHTERVVKIVDALALSFGLSEREVRDARRAALLANLGLLAVPGRILAKKGTLTEEERRLVREHPLRSLDAVRDFPFLAPLGRDILHHHERFDGQGYPEGLKGEDIPRAARLILVAETYEALTSMRPYRTNPYTKEEALEIMSNEAGKQLDPRVVESFLKQSA